MCGLVGIASVFSLTTAEKKCFQNMILVNQLRGTDSTGMFSVNGKGCIDVLKKAVDGTTFLQLNSLPKLLANNDLRVLAGHNRYATRGQVNHVNAHPFVHGDVAMMHNGTLHTQTGLRKPNYFGTDSECIAYNLSLDSPEEVVKNLDGAFAIVWYDERDHSLNMIRNKQRGLYYSYEDDKEEPTKRLLWASEEEMMYLCANRNGLDIGVWRELDELTHIKFDLEGTVVRISEQNKLEGKVHVIKANPYARNGTPKRPDSLPKLGDRVVLLPDAFEKYKGVSTKGKITGIVEDITGDALSAELHGVEASVFIEAKKCELTRDLFCSVSTVIYSFSDKEWQLKLVNSFLKDIDKTTKVVLKIEDKTKEGHAVKKSQAPLVGEVLPQEDNNPLTEDLSEQSSDWDLPYIEGADGTMLTIKQFNQYTRYGCANCSENLTADDSSDILWADTCTPLCLSCGAEYFNDVNGNQEAY